jgi:general L-amino acid transport system permease protein
MSYVRAASEPVLPARVAARPSPVASLFGDVASTLTTVFITFVALAALPRLFAWAVTNGVWRGDGDACRDAGACWAFLRVKMPFILFGIYPEAERWRPLLVVGIFIALTIWSLPRSHWTRATLFAWVAGLVAALLLMSGGTLGLTEVPTSSWGGLPITILLTVLSLALGFPMAVMLALGRRSRLPALRWLSTAFIEIVRGLPLLSMLFVASIMVPLLLPDGVAIDNLFRALVALTFSSAAYLAEVIRGGLQGVPRGQEEAARALGLGWGQAMRLVVLPQAIRNVIPPLTNTVVVIVKNTSLVLVVGLFDLLSAGRVALSDPDWPAPYAETYLMIALLYFAICYGFARYTLHLERTLGQVRR